MASITSIGVGSGLDADSIISKLVSIESQPLVLLQKQETDLKTELSSFGKIQSLVSDFEDAASDLSSVTLWNQTTATSADTAAVTATSASGAAAGSYAVKVSTLAASQTITSGVLPASGAAVSAGTLTIQLGKWTGSPAETGFTPKAGPAAVPITVTGTETLAQLRDKINAANTGVSATVINDANGARLSIRSKDTGAENGFQITATEDSDDGDDAAGLSALNYSALAASPMARNQKAQNTEATINGIGVSSATNKLDNVVDGLSLTLLKTTASEVNVTVAADTASVGDKIKSFVTAFNALSSYVRTQTAYNAASKTGGPLQGNRTAVGLQNQMRAILNQASSASGSFKTLSDIGIVMKQDGTLETKSSKLDAALANLPELRKVLATDSGTSASSGFMVRYRNLASQMLDLQGSVTTANDTLNTRIKTLQKREEDMQRRLDATQARLKAQYQALDTTMGSLSGMGGYLTAIQNLSSSG